MIGMGALLMVLGIVWVVVPLWLHTAGQPVATEAVGTGVALVLIGFGLIVAGLCR